MYLAVIAISQLEKITDDDPKREEAFNKVLDWISQQLEKGKKCVGDSRANPKRTPVAFSDPAAGENAKADQKSINQEVAMALGEQAKPPKAIAPIMPSEKSQSNSVKLDQPIPRAVEEPFISSANIEGQAEKPESPDAFDKSSGVATDEPDLSPSEIGDPEPNDLAILDPGLSINDRPESVQCGNCQNFSASSGAPGGRGHCCLGEKSWNCQSTQFAGDRIHCSVFAGEGAKGAEDYC